MKAMPQAAWDQVLDPVTRVPEESRLEALVVVAGEQRPNADEKEAVPPSRSREALPLWRMCTMAEWGCVSLSSFFTGSPEVLPRG